MATTKRLPAPPKTQAAVQKLIRYILTPEAEGVEKAIYSNSIQCDIPTAAEEFKQCRERWGKTGGNYAYHLVQSFKPGEVTPEEAYQCGEELARALFEDEYQVVFATHIDREHLHNHFAVCAVNLKDGHKLQTDHDFIRRMRAENDRVCRAHNLSVVGEPGQGGGKSYAEWLSDKNGGFTWRGQIRADIDNLIPQVTTLKELLAALEANLYTIKNGKYLSVSPPGTKSFFRLYKLGDGYSPEQLADRILGTPLQTPQAMQLQATRVRHIRLHSTFPRLQKRGGLRGLYFVYLYRLRKILGQPANRRMRYPFNCRRDARQIRDFADDLRVISEHGLQTMEDLIGFTQQIKSMQNRLNTQRSVLQERMQQADSPEDMAEIRQQLPEIAQKLEKLKQDLKSCNRIYQRSQTIFQNQKEIIETERTDFNGSRSRSNGYSPAVNNGGR